MKLLCRWFIYVCSLEHVHWLRAFKRRCKQRMFCTKGRSRTLNQGKYQVPTHSSMKNPEAPWWFNFTFIDVTFEGSLGRSPFTRMIPTKWGLLNRIMGLLCIWYIHETSGPNPGFDRGCALVMSFNDGETRVWYSSSVELVGCSEAYARKL